MGFGKTPPRLKRKIKRGPAKGTKLDFSLEEGTDFKRLKPNEKGDMRAPSLATNEDYKEVASMTSSPVQDELAELGKGRELIKRVQGMRGIQSKSNKKKQDIFVEQKPSGAEGGGEGGILEMFGLAGGRRRRRKSRRKKRRKSRRKRRKRTKKKRKRKSRRRRSRRRRR